MDINLHPSRRNFDLLLNEYHIVKQQLDSKIQALRILNQELEHCRNERDQFKVVIEQLNPLHTSPNGQQLKDLATNGLFPDSWRLKGQCDQLVMQRLCQMKEKNRQLQDEVRDSKAKLEEANGDIKTLREMLAKQNQDSADEKGSKWSRNIDSAEREKIVKQFESLKTKYTLLEKDLQSVLDEKEELICERDAHKNKVDRLNLELNFALKGDDKRIIDVDSILMENRYLQERLKQTQEEKSLYLQTLSKYRNILEKRRNRSALKFGENGSGSVIITHKQVEHMLQNTNITQLPATQATVADLRSLALALFESLNDKNIALAHQRKANKTLGLRLSELENKSSSLKLSDSCELNDEEIRAGFAEASNADVLMNGDGEAQTELTPSGQDTLVEANEHLRVKDLVKFTEPEPLTLELAAFKDNDLDVVLNERRESVSGGYLFPIHWSSIELEEEEDLPADLQKLVQAAIEDIDKKLSRNQNSQ